MTTMASWWRRTQCLIGAHAWMKAKRTSDFDVRGTQRCRYCAATRDVALRPKRNTARAPLPMRAPGEHVDA